MTRTCCVLTIICLAGCGAWNQRNSARTMMRDDNYDQAVTDLRQAIEINPSDQETQILLGDAETKAAEQRLQKAQQLLADHRPRQARQELAEALSYVPTHPVAIREAATADAAIAKSDALLRQAREALREQNWQQATDQAQAAAAIDRSLSESQAIIDAAQHETTEYPSQVAVAPVQPLPPAQPAPAPAASAARPSRPRVQPKPSPIPPDVQPPQPATALQPLSRTPTDRALRAAQVEIDAGRWSRALEILDQAATEQPDQQSLIAERSTVACRWGEELLHNAEQHAEQKAWEAAWIAAVQVRVLCSTLVERADELLNQAERGLDRELSYNLGIAPLAADAALFALSNKVAKQLKVQMESLQARTVRLIGPSSKAEPVSTNMLDLTNRKAVGQLARLVPKADLAVAVSVTSEAQDLRRPSEPGTLRHLASKQSILNPQYAVAEQAFNQARQTLAGIKADLMRNERDYDAVGRADLHSDRRFIARAATGYFGDEARNAAQAYKALFDELQKTPTQIDQEGWQEYHYPVQTVERRVTLRLQLQLVDLSSGEVVYRDDSTTAQATRSDTTNDADAEHNIPAKKPVLPSVEELRAEALSQMVGSLKEPARTVLARRAVEQVEQARRLPGSQAGPAYARFLFAGNGLVSPPQMRAGIEKLWQAATVQLLREPCTQLTLQRLQLNDQEAEAGAAAGQSFTGTVSVDNPSQPRELSTIDGIVIGIRGTRATPDADIDIRVGDRQLHYNGIPQGSSLSTHGASGTRYRLTLLAIDHGAVSAQFSLQRIP